MIWGRDLVRSGRARGRVKHRPACRCDHEAAGNPKRRDCHAEEVEDLAAQKQRHQQDHEGISGNPQRKARALVFRKTSRLVEEDEGQSVGIDDREQRAEAEQEIGNQPRCGDITHAAPTPLLGLRPCEAGRFEIGQIVERLAQNLKQHGHRPAVGDTGQHADEKPGHHPMIPDLTCPCRVIVQDAISARACA